MPTTADSQDPQAQLQEHARETWGTVLTEEKDRKQFSSPERTYDEWLQANSEYADRLRQGEVKVLRKRIAIFQPYAVTDYSDKAWEVEVNPTRAARLRRKHQNPSISRGTTYVPKSESIEHEGYLACPIWTLT